MEQRTKNLSVKKALLIGRIFITIPSIVIVLGFFTSSFFLADARLIPEWSIPLMYIAGIIFFFLYRGFIVTRWRLWAFSNARNVHDLKKWAINFYLIGKDGSYFEKFEFRTPADKLKWKILKKKFDIEDIFEDDQSYPTKTIVYYSSQKQVVYSVLPVLFTSIGICFAITGMYVLAILITIFGMYIPYTLNKYSKKKMKVTIDDKGIETASTKFYPWSFINDAKIVKSLPIIYTGSFTRIKKNYYLKYNYPGGKENIQILSSHYMFCRKIEKLVEIYRGRYEHKKVS
jgi:hypothetical protein